MLLYYQEKEKHSRSCRCGRLLGPRAPGALAPQLAALKRSPAANRLRRAGSLVLRSVGRRVVRALARLALSLPILRASSPLRFLRLFRPYELFACAGGLLPFALSRCAKGRRKKRWRSPAIARACALIARDVLLPLSSFPYDASTRPPVDLRFGRAGGSALRENPAPSLSFFCRRRCALERARGVPLAATPPLGLPLYRPPTLVAKPRRAKPLRGFVPAGLCHSRPTLFFHHSCFKPCQHFERPIELVLGLARAAYAGFGRWRQGGCVQ